MKLSEEGKLLARVAGSFFNHPGGDDRTNRFNALCWRALFSQSPFALFTVPAFLFHSHQGEREKNEYS